MSSSNLANNPLGQVPCRSTIQAGLTGGRGTPATGASLLPSSFSAEKDLTHHFPPILTFMGLLLHEPGGDKA